MRWSVAVLCMPWSATLWGQSTQPLDPWGPASGEVKWSLNQHAITWTTPRLTLTLDPWMTLRHVSGTPTSISEPVSSWDEAWDNLRGATFQAQLDEVWEVSGSLEEWQGIPSAWDAMWMTSEDAIPGWGRSKTTSGGRTDVARTRGTTSYVHSTERGDTLKWTAAYAPDHWGEMLSPLTLSGRAASYPTSRLEWTRNQSWQFSGHVARWTGTERSPLGGSTEALFRQSDAGWSTLTWFGKKPWSAGVLAGAVRERPWAQEQDTLSRFEPRGLFSAISSWDARPSSGMSVHAEWSWKQGYGLTLRSSSSSKLQWGLSISKLNARNNHQSAWLNAGTPVSEVLRYSHLDQQALRVEGKAQWIRGRWNIGGRAAIVAEAQVLEAWLGWTLQETWPLHLTTGVETWHVPSHPTLPSEGWRLRFGLAHRLSMSSGTPTFEAP